MNFPLTAYLVRFHPLLGLWLMLFAAVSYLASVNPEVRFAVLKVAFSGTGIRQDWDPTKQSEAENCYGALVKEWDLARKAAAKMDVHLKPRAFVWVQGESDATQAGAVYYAEEMKRLIAAVRELFEAPELKVLLAVNTRFGLGDKPYMPDIVEAQKQVAHEVSNCSYVDTSEATIANSAHYDTQGSLNVGQWLAEALLGEKEEH